MGMVDQDNSWDWILRDQYTSVDDVPCGPNDLMVL
jgi:hypothetical protein